VAGKNVKERAESKKKKKKKTKKWQKLTGQLPSWVEGRWPATKPRWVFFERADGARIERASP
jgi:hypothetical protein